MWLQSCRKCGGQRNLLSTVGGNKRQNPESGVFYWPNDPFVTHIKRAGGLLQIQ